jgi:hypothetical protein
VEVTLDLGEDTVDVLNQISKINDKGFTLTASEMLSLGSRIFMQSRENKEDKVTRILLENSVRTNEILVEIMHMIFNKETSKIGAYDAETALAIIERMVGNFLKGAN